MAEPPCCVLRRVKGGELSVKIWCVRLRGHIFIQCPVGRGDPTPHGKAFSLGEKVARSRAG